MDLAQLANGSVVYSPSGTDISFKMEVVDKSQKTTASESVRMLRTRPSPLQEQTDAAAKAAAAAGGTRPPQEPRLPQRYAQSGRSGGHGTAQAGPGAAEDLPAESLSQRLRPAASSDLPDAPTVSASDRSAPSAIPGVSMNTAAPAPFVPAPAPPAPAAATPAAATPTESKPKSGGQIQQAVLIYRKDAEYPRSPSRPAPKAP